MEALKELGDRGLRVFPAAGSIVFVIVGLECVPRVVVFVVALGRVLVGRVAAGVPVGEAVRVLVGV
jgi:hypothetical protein